MQSLASFTSSRDAFALACRTILLRSGGACGSCGWARVPGLPLHSPLGVGYIAGHGFVSVVVGVDAQAVSVTGAATSTPGSSLGPVTGGAASFLVRDRSRAGG